MGIHPLAGKPTPKELLIDVAALESAYYHNRPELGDPNQLVNFGTSGHRGRPDSGTFNEAHILAITQAICDYRRANGVAGPLFMGKDSHAASGPAQRTALEVLAANAVETVIQSHNGMVPTPAISRAILVFNRKHGDARADGIVITPSHNPPSDGGFKYNPPHGGPADADVTSRIQDRANELLAGGNQGVRRIPYERALKLSTTRPEDFVRPYVSDLGSVIDIERVMGAGLRIGADPLGGASLEYWELIRDYFALDLEVVNPSVDPTFRFMPLDHDGVIRMDCSSPYAMAGLVNLSGRFDVAFGNDADADRHGIVTPSTGLMNPNHFLAVAIRYLLEHRPLWSPQALVGKTLVSSKLIDRVVEQQGRRLSEVPVGFKWFAPGLFDGSLCFGGEESAGASFLRKDGTVWTTDKDGIIMCLLAAEITAVTGKDPGSHFEEITEQLGTPFYRRVDTPATPEQKDRLKKLTPRYVTATELAGEPILASLTNAPGNNAPIGGLKVVTRNGWFAARPSGTEDIYKLYAESFKSEAHLNAILEEAKAIVKASLEIV